MAPPVTVSTSPTRTDQIVAATRRLFVRHGYRRSSMDDIAREAGLAKATLYLHFAGKDDIFAAMLTQCRAEIAERAKAAEQRAAPIEERLASLLYAYYGTALEWFGDAQHLRELRLIMSESPTDFGHTSEGWGAAQVIRMIDGAGRRGEIDLGRLGMSAKRLAGILLQAASGAKHVGSPAPEEYRARLDDIARLVEAATRC